MNDQLYQISLSKLTAEILSIGDKIEELEREREDKILIKEYIQKNAVSVNEADSISINNANKDEDSRNDTTIKSKTDASISINNGISDFIISQLSTGSKDTKTLIQAYASSLKVEASEVNNNISNALSRLQTAGKINGTAVSEKNRKAGKIWTAA